MESSERDILYVLQRGGGEGPRDRADHEQAARCTRLTGWALRRGGGGTAERRPLAAGTQAGRLCHSICRSDAIKDLGVGNLSGHHSHRAI